MPAIGDTVTQFGREWIYVNPDSATGPGVWRLSSSDVIASGDATEILGQLPIEVDVNATPGAPTEATVSMDITQLPNSADV